MMQGAATAIPWDSMVSSRTLAVWLWTMKLYCRLDTLEYKHPIHALHSQVGKAKALKMAPHACLMNGWHFGSLIDVPCKKGFAQKDVR